MSEEARARPEDGAGLELGAVLRHGIAALSLGAGVLHASAAADHVGLPAHAAFFLGVAAIQSLLAGLVACRRTGLCRRP